MQFDRVCLTDARSEELTVIFAYILIAVREETVSFAPIVSDKTKFSPKDSTHFSFSSFGLGYLYRNYFLLVRSGLMGTTTLRQDYHYRCEHDSRES